MSPGEREAEKADLKKKKLNEKKMAKIKSNKNDVITFFSFI